ncbi:MAG: NADH-quinone oxidoreductase subunit A [Ignavibacteria bacterium]|nr:NADH-quinone oxidoreductase subunit A [Ignavibacteria bacterium]
MLTEFGKIFAFLIFSIVFVLIALISAKIVAPARPTREKLLTYECGENPLGTPWIKFNFRFYVVALIFLIFDVEIVLLLPWAVTYRQWGLEGFAIGAIFLILLVLGMAYEWRKGDLEWERPLVRPPATPQASVETELHPVMENESPITEISN